MPDIRGNERHSAWLEGELGRQLCPVSAPDTLWNRIHEQRRPLRVVPDRRLNWMLVAAALIALFGISIWRLKAAQGPAVNLETLATAELRGFATGAGTADILSSDPEEIQRWIRANSDIDVRIPKKPGLQAGIRLRGARLIRAGKFSAAAITWRAGDAYAALVVADRPAAGGLVTDGQSRVTKRSPEHSVAHMRSSSGVKLSSWATDMQDYAIAVTDGANPERACLLCHVYTPALAVFR